MVSRGNPCKAFKKLGWQARLNMEHRAAELATLKDLRQAMQKTQVDLAAALHIGQDSISRLEKRSDMLLSTLRGYIEAMGGKLEIVARFPNRPPVTIEHLADH
jgi:DNA-binding XRE family transcriptional regulator